MSTDHDLGAVSHLVLGRYRVVQRLAKGGMGVVYLGRLEGAAGFAKPVVIKRIIQDSEDPTESTARFIREAQILSNLQHPGIVGVLDFGEEAEGHAMILEYVHGYDLARWLKYLQVVSDRMHWEEAVFILLRVLDALSYAHGFRRSDGVAAQVLHRDISPGNVLIDVDGRVRLLDFGIARMAEDDQYRTQTGVLKGKVPFLAPELFASDPPSAASDIYACGVVLYQMLTGTHPFTGENDSKLMWRIITEGPKPLSEWRNDLPVGLEAPIFVALNKDPGHRHASAERFAAELRQTLCRRETEIGVALRERVQRDFNGEMPSLLRLESLAERDRAWRQVRATLPPAASAPSRTVSAAVDAPRVSTRASQPTLTASTPEQEPKPATERTRNASRRALPESSPASVPRPAPAAAPVALPPTALRTDWRSLVSLGMGAGLVVAALLALVLHFVEQRTPVGAARFIVVESPDKSTLGAAGAPPVGAAVPARSPSAPPAAENVAGRSPTASPSHALEKTSDAAALSRRFARQEGALQQCFQRFASGLTGVPQISVYFQVTAAGKVQAATLDPGSLEGTPLGHCLLEVARGTAFGALGKPLRFTIPIRARSVTR